MTISSPSVTVKRFPHDKTTHQFRMMADDGAIEVTVNDPNDSPKSMYGSRRLVGVLNHDDARDEDPLDEFARHSESPNHQMAKPGKDPNFSHWQLSSLGTFSGHAAGQQSVSG